ncbi:MAG: ribosome silencing factor [Ignavibacteriae bacterium]|nr:ribosome silencing factor [Ignavibacteriota bacterium]
MKSSTLATAVANLALTKKAHNVVVMDLRPLTSMTDYFVICSADSESQIKAIADAVLEGTEKRGVAPWHKETGSPNWNLLDYSDVVLHIFHKNTRGYYNLEKLWGDAKTKTVVDEPAAARRRKPAAKQKAAPKRKKPSAKKKVA